MKTTKLQDAPAKDTPHKVDVRPMADTPHAQAMHITLEPGEALLPHATPVDVLFYILEGSPTIVIGQESEKAAPDTMVESPKNIVHRILNETKERARVLVIKTPRPDTPSRML